MFLMIRLYRWYWLPCLWCVHPSEHLDHIVILSGLLAFIPLLDSKAFKNMVNVLFVYRSIIKSGVRVLSRYVFG